MEAPWLRACPPSLVTTQEWPKGHQGSPELIIFILPSPGIQAREGLRGRGQRAQRAMILVYVLTRGDICTRSNYKLVAGDGILTLSL